jgi:hypothetical protein
MWDEPNPIGTLTFVKRPSFDTLEIACSNEGEYSHR